MGWWKIDFPWGLPGWEEKMERIRQEFGEIHMMAGSPSASAMFQQYLEDDGSVLYFSPLAAALASELLQEFAATPCDEPAGEDVVAIIGGRSSLRNS